MKDVFEEKMDAFICGHKQSATAKEVLERWAERSPFKSLAGLQQYVEKLLANEMLKFEETQGKDGPVNRWFSIKVDIICE